MDATEILVATLQNHSEVTALIGVGPVARLYPVNFPEGEFALPAIIYKRLTKKRSYTHSGATELVRPIYSLQAWAETYTDATALADAIVKACHSIRDSVCFVLSEYDDPVPDLGEQGLYRVFLEAELHHREEVA